MPRESQPITSARYDASRKRNITPAVRKTCELYFDCKLGDQDKNLARRPLYLCKKSQTMANK